MDDYYCFRKIKSTALVMIAVVAVHVALSLPLGYYWNALQASLSDIELSLSGTPSVGNASQGLIIYLLLFGVVALLAFLTSPKRTRIWWRLILIVPLAIFLYSAYLEYGKISPINEKFKDIYDSLEFAIFVPHLAIAAVTVVYLFFVIVLPMFGITQVFGWAAAVVAIISYLGSALFIVYSHTMTILEGSFGASEFYTYLVVFALDVVSYFVLLSVLMTYCTIKREERWDRLEARSIAEENGQDFEALRIGSGTEHETGSGRWSLFSRKRSRADDLVSYDEPLGDADYDLRKRYIPDIEDLKEHEFHTGEHEAYSNVAKPVVDDKPVVEDKAVVKDEPAVKDKAVVKDKPAVKPTAGDASTAVRKSDAEKKSAAKNKPGSKKKFISKKTPPERSKPVDSDRSVAGRERVANEKPMVEKERVAIVKPMAEQERVAIEKPAVEQERVANGKPAVKQERVAEEKPATKQERVAEEKPAVEKGQVTGENPVTKKPPIVGDEHRAEKGFLAKDKPTENKESAMKYESVAAEYKSAAEDGPVVANRANRHARGDSMHRSGKRGNTRPDARSGKRPREQ